MRPRIVCTDVSMLPMPLTSISLFTYVTDWLRDWLQRVDSLGIFRLAWDRAYTHLSMRMRMRMRLLARGENTCTLRCDTLRYFWKGRR